MKPTPKPVVMYAWWDEIHQHYRNLYDSKFLVELAKGSKQAVKRAESAGEGCLVKVTVAPVTKRKPRIKA